MRRKMCVNHLLNEFLCLHPCLFKVFCSTEVSSKFMQENATIFLFRQMHFFSSNRINFVRVKGCTTWYLCVLYAGNFFVCCLCCSVYVSQLCLVVSALYFTFYCTVQLLCMFLVIFCIAAVAFAVFLIVLFLFCAAWCILFVYIGLVLKSVFQ